MRAWGGITFYFAVALVIQTAVPPVAGVRPDLLLLGILAVTMLLGSKEGLAAGLLGGIFQDLMSGISGGFFTLTKGGLSLMTGLLKARLVPDPIFIPALTGFAGTFLHEWLFYGLTSLAHWQLLTYSFREHLLPLALANAALSPLVFLAVRRLVGHRG